MLSEERWEWFYVELLTRHFTIYHCILVERSLYEDFYKYINAKSNAKINFPTSMLLLVLASKNKNWNFDSYVNNEKKGLFVEFMIILKSKRINWNKIIK